eukprot:COSAG02_NODE_128_length_34833_cov_44.465221_3_plen_82_part_00
MSNPSAARRAGEGQGACRTTGELMSDVQEQPLYKRALECQSTELILSSESMRLAACAARLCAPLSFLLACFLKCRNELNCI